MVDTIRSLIVTELLSMLVFIFIITLPLSACAVPRDHTTAISTDFWLVAVMFISPPVACILLYFIAESLMPSAAEALMVIVFALKA